MKPGFRRLAKSPQDLSAGKCLLDSLIKRGLEQHQEQVSALIRLLVLCGSLAEAHHVFLSLHSPSAFAWSAIISAHTRLGHPRKALLLFAQMQRSPAQADEHVFVAALSACRHCESAALPGRCIHSQIIESSTDGNQHVGAVLIEFYNKLGSVHDAYAVFVGLEMQDVVTYTSMLGGFVHCGYPHKAVELFFEMQSSGIEPNQASFVSILKACMIDALYNLAVFVHDLTIQSGYGSDTIVCNAIIDGYVACGKLSDGYKVFRRLTQPDAVSWCIIITGFVEQGQGRHAQALLQNMQQQGIHFDQALFVCSLKVCSVRGALEQGQLLHALVLDSSFASDLTVANALIHMYTCCGSFLDAWKVFLTLPERSLVTWSTIVAGLRKDKQFARILECFEYMEQDWQRTSDATTYVTLLSSCIDEGLVHESFAHFKRMVEKECIPPTLIHYNCLIELLRHSGWLKEAFDLLETMPFQDNFVGQTSLLSCCNMHKESGLAKLCGVHTLPSEGDKLGGHVLISDIPAYLT